MLPSKQEIKEGILNPDSLSITELNGYNPMPGLLGPLQFPGGFSIVFPFTDGIKKKAVRIWHREIQSITSRTKIISTYLNSIDKPACFVNYCFYPKAFACKGSLLDVVVMDWIEGHTLKDYINNLIIESHNKADLKESFLQLIEKFLTLFKSLHYYSIAHGDLQHGNVIVDNSGELKLIDYDSLYVPSLGSTTRPTTIGLSGYQHPKRKDVPYISSRDDYFSELVIIASLFILSDYPEIWNKFSLFEDDYSLVFSATDFQDLKKSKITQLIKDKTSYAYKLVLELDSVLKSSDFLTFNNSVDIMSALGYNNFVSQSLYCINCSNKFGPEDVYCIKCGTKRV